MADPEKKNASQFPKIYYARHMQPGICRYDNEDVLVDTDAIKSMLPSAVGKPVYVQHDEGTNEERLKNLKKDADGYITEAFYNELDGWAWFKFLVVDDRAHTAVAKGWKVSNAYLPGPWGVGGTKNNMPYHREILGGEFTHLAIVPNPRYEQALILNPDEFKAYNERERSKLNELRNDNPATEKDSMKNILSFFTNEKKEVAAADVKADTMVEIKNDKGEVLKVVSVKDMIDEVTNAKKNDDDAKKKADDEEKEKANRKQMVNVGGKEMPLDELVNEYQKMCAKKNEGDDEEEKKKKAAAEKEKENDDEDDEEAKKKKDKENKNSKKPTDEEIKNAEDAAKQAQKNFDELRNAHRNAKEPVRIIETSMSKTERGKQRYGS